MVLSPVIAVTAIGCRLRGSVCSVAPKSLDNLRFLVTELVTNSVVHAGLDPEDGIGLKISATPSTIRTEVSDGGLGFDLRNIAPLTLDRLDGRGLYLVEMLAESWGVEREDGLTRVWFEVHSGTGSSTPAKN